MVLAGRSGPDRWQDGGDEVGWLNREAASLLPQETSPVGEHVTVSGIARPIRILGVVADVKYLSLKEPQRPGLYLPRSAATWPVLTAVIARVEAGTEPRVKAAMRQAAFAAAPDAPLDRLQAGPERRDELLAHLLFGRWLLGVLGSTSLALTVAGVYTALLAAAKRDTRSIAVRIACGATPQRIIADLARHRSVPMGIGLFVGICATAIVDGAIRRFTDGIGSSLMPLVLSVGALIGIVAVCILGVGVGLVGTTPRQMLADVDPA
jgi:hypothetical protein